VTGLSRSARRFQDALAASGHDIDIVTLSDSTRTAQEAADTIGCEVAQIAKSIVFRNPDDDEPVLVIASGSNRVSVDKLKALLGKPLTQADGNYVKKRLGYAIGGVPPAGHLAATTIVLDEDLKQYAELWAAAGTPFAVFRVAPGTLPEMTGGAWHDVAER